MITRPMSASVIYMIMLTLFFTGSMSFSLTLSERYPNKISVKVTPSDQKEIIIVCVLSSHPLADSSGRLLTAMSTNDIDCMSNSPLRDRLVIKLRGVCSPTGWCEFNFSGSKTGDDAKRIPWADLSDEIWDNCAIGIQGEEQVRIREIIIVRGGQKLYDTTAKKTYANNRPIDFSLMDNDDVVTASTQRLLNLSDAMTRFRQEYYELRGTILVEAYADLGQTDRRKYSKVDHNWCSEFATYFHHLHGFRTPNPYLTGVNASNIRDAFMKFGTVYTYAQIAGMTNDERIKAILPGSIVCSGGHTFIFTCWVTTDNPVRRYALISGNNREMVWAHAIHEICAPEEFARKSEKEIKDHARDNFIAVPAYKDGVGFLTTFEDTARRERYSKLTSIDVPLVLLNRNSFLAAGVAGGALHDGVTVMQTPFRHGKNQLWRLVNAGSECRIINMTKGQAMSVLASGDSSCRIVLQSPIDGPSQKWHIEQTDTGAFRFVWFGNRYLTVAKNSTNEREALSLTDKSDDPAALWQVEFDE